MKETEEEAKALENTMNTISESKEEERYSFKQFLSDLRMEQRETM